MVAQGLAISVVVCRSRADTQVAIDELCTRDAARVVTVGALSAQRKRLEVTLRHGEAPFACKAAVVGARST